MTLLSPTIALGLIVHPRDAAFLPQFLARHAGFFHCTCIVVDSEEATPDELREVEAVIREYAGTEPDSLRLVFHALSKDFAAQRNRCAALNPCEWLLMLDADESLRVRSLKLLRPALAEMTVKYPGVRVFGLARDNSIDGKTLKTGHDWQYRLVRRGVTWRNTAPEKDASPGCHEMPLPVHDDQGAVMNLEHLVILHEKTMARQRAQNRFYEGMA